MKHFEIETDKNILYTKTGCPHCARAKTLLEHKGISYEERDILESELYKRQFLALMKNIVDPEEPITTPQIWFTGRYIGGTKDLEKYLQ